MLIQLRVSNTRCSARADACRALYNLWDEIINGLVTIKNDILRKMCYAK